MKKYSFRYFAAATLLLSFSAFVLFLEIFGVITVVKEASMIEIEVELLDIKTFNGPILFLIMPFKFGTVRKFVDLTGLCDCYIIQYGTKTQNNQTCKMAKVEPQLLTPSRILHKTEQISYLNVFEMPKVNGRKEQMLVNCSHTSLTDIGFMFGTFSMGLGALYDRVDVEDNRALINFFTQAIPGFGFEMSLASSGYFNKILIEKKVLHRYGKNIDVEDAKFSETISRTSTGNLEYTELIIAYGSDHFTHYKEVKIESLWKLGYFLVTALLSWERIWAMKTRILDSRS